MSNLSELLTSYNNETIAEPYRFPTIFIVLYSGTGIFGIISGIVTIVHIVLNFNCSKSLYIGIIADSIVNIMGCFLQTGASIALLGTPEENKYSERNCTALGLTIMTYQAGPCFLALVSFVRWRIIKSTQSANEVEGRNRVLVIVSAFVIVIYWSIIAIITQVKGGYSAPIERFCIHGEEFHLEVILPITHLFVVIPYILATICPFITDLLTLKKVHETVLPSLQQEGNLHQQAATSLNPVQNGENQPKNRLEIPIKATVISAIFGTVSLVLGIVAARLGNNMDRQLRIILLPVVSSIVNIIRVPIIVKLTIRKNHMNAAALSKAHDRTRRQAIEMEAARKARAARRAIQNNDS